MTSFEAENIGQDPSPVSLKQDPTAVVKAALSAATKSSTQQSEAVHTAEAQLTAEKLLFNDWPVGHDEETKGVLAPSMLPHVGVVQHSFPLSAQKVQTVVEVVPILAEESGHVTTSLSVFFLPHLPHDASREQVPLNIVEPG